MRCVLRDFQDRMGLLAAFAFVSYYGSLLLVDAWAPWQPLTGVNAARNFAAIIIPACGYGVSFLGAEEHVRAEEMRKKSIHGSADWFEKPARHAE